MRARFLSFATVSWLLAVFVAAEAFAETRSWASPVHGSWSDPTRWSPAGVPVTGDAVVVPVSGWACTITLDLNTPQLASLDFANSLGTLLTSNTSFSTTSGAHFSGRLECAGSTFVGGPLETRVGSNFVLHPGGVLTLGGPTWTNAGMATLSAPDATSLAYLRPNASTLIAGAGTLRLRHADLAIMDSPGGWEFTQAAAHTLAGEGVVTAPLRNLGTVVADVTGHTLGLHALRSNGGTLRATNGGRLWIVGSSVDGTGGTVHADGGLVELTSSHLGGGSTLASGAGTLDFTGGCSMANVSNSGVQRVRPGANVTLLGSTFTNDGTLDLGEVGAASAAYLRPGSHVVLQGTGEVRLRDAAQSVFDSPGGWTVTQSVGHTIRGAGYLTVPLVNHGDVQADVAGAALQILGTHTNDGTLRSTSGGVLALSSVGLANSGGQVLAAGGDVTLQNTSITGGALSAAAGSTIHYLGGVVTADATLAGEHRVHEAANVTWLGSHATNHGHFQIGAAGMISAAYLRPGAQVTLGGAGSIELVDENLAILDSPGGWALTQAAGHTIHGAGVVTTPLVNHGLVAADASGRRLYVSGSVTSDGVLRASGGGRMQLQNCTLSNASGTLAADGGTVDLASTSVDGGTITRTGTSVVHLREAVALANLVHTGEMRLHEASQLILRGTGIRNDGTISLSQPGDAQVAWCRPDAHVTLSGTGRVVLDRHDLAVFDSPGGWTVTQADSHSIRGTGWFTAPLVNRGTIRADRDSGALEVAGTTSHSGVCEAVGGGVLRFTVHPTNLASGVLTGGTWRAYANSAIRFVGASVHTNAAALVLDGERSRIEADDAGNSALAGLARNAPGGMFAVRNGRRFLATVPFTNEGTLMVGDRSAFVTESPGLADAGATDFEQKAGGTLVVEVAGRQAGRWGRVEVHGKARLTGVLRVVTLGDFVPTPGDSFVVMTFDERDGAFTYWQELQVAPGVWLSPVWEARRLVLVARTQPNVDVVPPPPASLAFGTEGPASARVLRLALPGAAHACVELFDPAGRRVATLVNDPLEAGVHRWNVGAGPGLWLARATIRGAEGVRVMRTKLIVWR